MDSNQDIIRFLSLLDERIGHLDTVKLISNVLRFITKQLKLKRASVAILKPDHSGFIIRDVTFDIKEMETGRFLPFTSTPQSLCIQDLKPLYRPDIEKSKPAFEVDAKLLASGLKSDFLVPLIIGDQCLGTLNSGSEKVNGISEYNYHLEMPDGKHWYSTKLSLIFEKGEYAGLIAVSRDITEHKEAEEELRQHREHLEELVKVRTADLEEKNIELARFNKLFVGREFRIKELRDEIMELEKRLHHK